MRTKLLEQLSADLQADRIDYSKAFEVLKAQPKAWTTKEWNEKSKLIKKNYCEDCNTTEGPFVIQHTKQPVDFYEIYNRLSFERLLEKTTDFEGVFKQRVKDEVEREIATNFEMRESCPVCRTINIRTRKTMSPKYVCKENHAFDTPIVLKYYKKSQTTDIEIARKKGEEILLIVVKLKMIKEIQELYDQEIGREALLICIADGIEYMEMKHTKTACKKCSFKEDMLMIYQKGIPYFLRFQT
ncbi:hypothetical protein OCK74_14915 [Chitinophagaceae bacterium LB-8]|uniref:Uncharacterized protein n=1 Tax=Paraflavisolibacter caeni TaxID=2982496 RepID=A0A9X2XWL6_9BACT|nr:hypothetical protein [Paraflavisolibacter caeni]MCU7550410.1 hypothetical protein [Paraflavisolibacter caeni]